jgi:leucyl-tRNA synthetase
MIQSYLSRVVYYKPENCFISSDIADQYNPDDCAEFLIKSEMVSDYGSTTSAHLTDTGIEAFIAWRKEFSTARFIKSPTQPDKFFIRSDVGKMSKSKHNVVNPDEIIDKYGADALRLFEMFLGPIEQSKPWNTSGITGVAAFLRKLWSLFYNEKGQWLPTDATPTADDERTLHTCIKKVTEDIERISLNTCVSHFMVAVNEFKKTNCTNKAVLTDYLVLLAPFAPFMTEELWHRLGNTTSIHTAAWPVFNPAKLVTDTIEYPVCINGKKRAELVAPNGTSHAELQEQALALAPIQKWLDGQTPKKIVIVPNRMINIVM